MARIIIASSSPAVRAFLTAVLKGDDHTLYEADDVPSALDLIERNRIDAVVVRLQYGHRLCQRIRRNPPDRRPRTIMLVGPPDSIEAQVGEACADRCLPGTLAPNALIRALDEVLRGKGTTDQVAA